MRRTRQTKTQPRPNATLKKGTPAKKSDRLSVLEIAVGMGCSRETVRKRMADSGISADEFTLKQVVAAFARDYQTAENPKDRLALAQAIKVERENAEADRELVSLTEVEKELSEKVIHPVRSWVMDQPSRLSNRCNQEHPEIAAMALKQDGDELIKILRDKLPKDIHD